MQPGTNNCDQTATAWYGNTDVPRSPWTSASQPATAPCANNPGGKLDAGEVLAGRYRLEHALGSGSFATVRAAWDLSLFRHVAIKIYAVSSAGAISSDEARLQATCQHPNLMPLYDAGTDPRLSVSFLVMPLYPGADLGATLNRFGPLPFRAAVLCVDQVCSALDFLWRRRQTLHGDIKPSNIWLTQSGAALLMDFNLPGLLARSGSDCAGTPGFMPPEVFHGQRDQSSDVFALGCVLYQCLTGVAAFVDNEAAAAGAYAPVRRLRPDVRPQLESVVRTALHPDPSVRYQSAREMQSALRHRGRSEGTSWLLAIWLGGVACMACLLRCLACGYRTGWKHLRRFVRHASRKPGQAAVEAIFLIIVLHGARQWMEAHRSEIVLALAGISSLALVCASVAAKFRNDKSPGGKRWR